MGIRLGFVLVGLALLPGRLVFADTTSGSLQEVAPVRSTPKFNMDLFGWTYGNAFANWNGMTVKPDGSPDSPVQITTQITMRTPAFGPFDLAVTPQFVIQPMVGSLGERFRLANPAVGLSGVLFSGGGFTYWARYEVVAPLLASSREGGMLFTPQAINALSFQAPGSKFRIDAVIAANLTLFQGLGSSGFVYASPRLYYLIDDSFWLISIVESMFSTERTDQGGSLLGLSQAAPINVGFGVRYTTRKGKGLWIQPFVDIFPEGRIASNAHLGVHFGGPIL